MLIPRKLSTLVFIILFSISGLVVAENKPANELQKLLLPIVTLKAQFQQTVFSENNKIVQKSSGNLEFKRPNLFRWQVDLPEKNLVVTNGRKLWNYDTDLEQVTVQDYKSSNEVSPVSFLFDDVAKLNSDFVIVKINQSNFKLTPRKENASFVSVEVGFTGNQLKVLRLLDHLGQTSVFEFNKVSNNPRIADSRFDFAPPAGVDVIGEL